MYPQGYFRQRITPEGWQEAAYAPFNRDESPIHLALTPSGEPCRFAVEMGGRRVTAAVWKVLVGRITLYLIDTDVPENSPEDRALSARLYGGDQEMRICQEILLGIGGVRMLRALGISPSVWHANEGHSAFLTLGAGAGAGSKGFVPCGGLRTCPSEYGLHDAHARAGWT